MHTSIRSIDYLTDIINDLTINKLSSTSSDFAGDEDKLQLHRTNCSALIKFVIARSLHADLIKDIANAPFSIITCPREVGKSYVKYYSESKNIVITQFLKFFKVVYTTADVLFQTVVDYFKSVNFNLNNLVDIGTDASSSTADLRFALIDCDLVILGYIIVAISNEMCLWQ
ncbi:hypothetical protein HUJ05_007577 [Dendroctonus ponderosae]|nr:hypothetical protein HUJ05_007577 [Dendroctonus ponderosae]